MIINIFNNASEPIALEKNLRELFQTNGVLKDETSVINPVFLIKNANLVKANYIVVPTLNRAYFIDNIVSINTNLWELHCHVDVLTTYSNNIKNLLAVVRRQNNKFNLFLDDSEFKSYVDTFEQTLLFPNGVASGGKNYLLLTSGG